MRNATHGFTLVELLIVVALIGVLASLSAPFLMAAKKASNEASAIGSMKAINSAQLAYSNSCGGNYFTTSLATLVAGAYISPDIALLPKSGFTVTMAAGGTSVAGAPDCMARPTATGYYASALPGGVEAARRGFATNQGGTVWEDRTGAVPTEPFTKSPTVGPIE
jgi:prepilin-type N-terminal cleavage/methylation domain-containing protein